jgi:hypothetical protein
VFGGDLLDLTASGAEFFQCHRGIVTHVDTRDRMRARRTPHHVTDSEDKQMEATEPVFALAKSASFSIVLPSAERHLRASHVRWSQINDNVAVMDS